MHKNDQYRDGHVSVFDYWSRKPTCPVGITERISSLLPDSGGSSYPIVCRIVNSRHSEGRFHKSLVSYFTTYASFSPIFRPLFLMQVLYVTQSIGIGRANDPGFRSLAHWFDESKV